MANVLISNNNINTTQQMVRPNVSGSSTSLSLDGLHSCFGSLVYTTASSAQALTLPDPTSGGLTWIDYWIKFICANTSNALTTINVSGGNIQGKTSIVMGAGDGATFVVNDGVNYTMLSQVLQPNNFRAYLSSSGTYPATPTTLVVVFDTKNTGYLNGDYDNTMGVFTPKLPGKYLVTAQINISITLVTLATFQVQLLLNGTAVDSAFYTTTFNSTATCKVEYFGPMNGSTDNLKVQVSQTGAATQTIVPGTDGSYFDGYRVSLF